MGVGGGSVSGGTRKTGMGTECCLYKTVHLRREWDCVLQPVCENDNSCWIEGNYPKPESSGGAAATNRRINRTPNAFLNYYFNFLFWKISGMCKK